MPEEGVRLLDAETFVLPEYLGTVRDAWKTGEAAGDGATPTTTIIHIQDAHCNYEGQRRVAEIIDYVNKNYGIKTVNLEGGAERYDLSPLTDITDAEVRQRVADYFVKDGRVNGAEYLAATVPEKINLWGVEDTTLYIENLGVYRASLEHKKEVDGHLGTIGYILTNLKIKIFPQPLLELDAKYTQYKASNLDFKDYLTYLIDTAKARNIDIKQLTSIYLLHQTLAEEMKIDFRKANNERDDLTAKLEKKLVKKAIGELIAKTVDFKAGRLSQKDYYAFLAETAASVNMDLSAYPELQKYIVYVSMYSAIDKLKIMSEVSTLEKLLKETMFENDTQRRLDVLSKNLALLKNMFAISLTRDDYRYYLDNKESFDMGNYVSFIEREAPARKIDARLDDTVRAVDGYREEIARFYGYSFERDEAFLKNMKTEDVSAQGGGKRAAMIVTGGFHTENLCELFRAKRINYVSIMPNFINEPGYKSPYFDLLAGRETGIERAIDAATSAMQIYSLLSPLMTGALGLDGKAVNVFRLSVRAMVRLEKGQGYDFRIRTDKALIVLTMGEDGTIGWSAKRDAGWETADCDVVVTNAAVLDNMTQTSYINPQIQSAAEATAEDPAVMAPVKDALVDPVIGYMRDLCGEKHPDAIGELENMKGNRIFAIGQTPGKNVTQDWAGHAGRGIVDPETDTYTGGIYLNATVPALADEEALMAKLVHEAMTYNFDLPHDFNTAVELDFAHWRKTGEHLPGYETLRQAIADTAFRPMRLRTDAELERADFTSVPGSFMGYLAGLFDPILAAFGKMKKAPTAPAAPRRAETASAEEAPFKIVAVDVPLEDVANRIDSVREDLNRLATEARNMKEGFDRIQTEYENRMDSRRNGAAFDSEYNYIQWVSDGSWQRPMERASFEAKIADDTSSPYGRVADDLRKLSRNYSRLGLAKALEMDMRAASGIFETVMDYLAAVDTQNEADVAAAAELANKTLAFYRESVARLNEITSLLEYYAGSKGSAGMTGYGASYFLENVVNRIRKGTGAAETTLETKRSIGRAGTGPQAQRQELPAIMIAAEIIGDTMGQPLQKSIQVYQENRALFEKWRGAIAEMSAGIVQGLRGLDERRMADAAARAGHSIVDELEPDTVGAGLMGKYTVIGTPRYNESTGMLEITLQDIDDTEKEITLELRAKALDKGKASSQLNGLSRQKGLPDEVRKMLDTFDTWTAKNGTQLYEITDLEKMRDYGLFGIGSPGIIAVPAASLIGSSNPIPIFHEYGHAYLASLDREAAISLRNAMMKRLWEYEIEIDGERITVEDYFLLKIESHLFVTGELMDHYRFRAAQRAWFPDEDAEVSAFIDSTRAGAEINKTMVDSLAAAGERGSEAGTPAAADGAAQKAKLGRDLKNYGWLPDADRADILEAIPANSALIAPYADLLAFLDRLADRAKETGIEAKDLTEIARLAAGRLNERFSVVGPLLSIAETNAAEISAGVARVGDIDLVNIFTALLGKKIESAAFFHLRDVIQLFRDANRPDNPGPLLYAMTEVATRSDAGLLFLVLTDTIRYQLRQNAAVDDIIASIKATATLYDRIYKASGDFEQTKNCILSIAERAGLDAQTLSAIDGLIESVEKLSGVLSGDDIVDIVQRLIVRAATPKAVAGLASAMQKLAENLTAYNRSFYPQAGPTALQMLESAMSEPAFTAETALALANIVTAYGAVIKRAMGVPGVKLDRLSQQQERLYDVLDSFINTESGIPTGARILNNYTKIAKTIEEAATPTSAEMLDLIDLLVRIAGAEGAINDLKTQIDIRGFAVEDVLDFLPEADEGVLGLDLEAVTAGRPAGFYGRTTAVVGDRAGVDYAFAGVLADAIYGALPKSADGTVQELADGYKLTVSVTLPGEMTATRFPVTINYGAVTGDDPFQISPDGRAVTIDETAVGKLAEDIGLDSAGTERLGSVLFIHEAVDAIAKQMASRKGRVVMTPDTCTAASLMLETMVTGTLEGRRAMEALWRDRESRGSAFGEGDAAGGQAAQYVEAMAGAQTELGKIAEPVAVETGGIAEQIALHQELTVTALTSRNNELDQVTRIVITLPIGAQKDMQGLVQDIKRQMKQRGYGGLRDDQIVPVFVKDPRNLSAEEVKQLQNKINGAKADLKDRERVVAWVPSASIDAVSKGLTEEKKDSMTVLKDAYQDADYPDIMLRVAVGRKIGYYYNASKERQPDILNELNDLLAAACDGFTRAGTIEAIINSIIAIKKIDYSGDMARFIATQKATATSL